MNKMILEEFDLAEDEWEYLSEEEQEDYRRAFHQGNLDALERVNDNVINHRNRQMGYRVVDVALDVSFPEEFRYSRALERDRKAEKVLYVVYAIAVVVIGIMLQ